MCTGEVLEIYWTCAAEVLDMNWRGTVGVLDMCCRGAGCALEGYCRCTGHVLQRCWMCTGGVLEMYWTCAAVLEREMYRGGTDEKLEMYWIDTGEWFWRGTEEILERCLKGILRRYWRDV